MSSNIILNKNNINNNFNSELRYEFNKPHTFQKGDTIAVSHINLFYSWFNITKVYNNNKFQYVWWDINGELTDIIDVVIPDGYYSINTLNEFLQPFSEMKLTRSINDFRNNGLNICGLFEITVLP